MIAAAHAFFDSAGAYHCPPVSLSIRSSSSLSSSQDIILTDNRIGKSEIFVSSLRGVGRDDAHYAFQIVVGVDHSNGILSLVEQGCSVILETIKEPGIEPK